MASTIMSYRPGDSFGRYELVSRLGFGGMAETWRARLLGAAGVTKPILIKRILSAHADNEAFISMFINEARISATLSHGNIAQVHDFGKVDGEYFLAMEFVDGQPLDRILKRAQAAGLSALPPQLATFIALEMCRGLHYAHTRKDSSGKPLGLVHRDISPDNVLVSYEGEVKIVDFGIAKARANALTNITAPGVVKGKYLFFSPEQACGEEADARTDVWATGITLYQLLCGRLPADGPEHAVTPKLIKGLFPPPSELRKDLPAELNAITMRALALKREDRFASSHEFGEALAGFLYTSTPRFSAMSLSYFVQDLFREDLAAEGREVQVPLSFREEMDHWKKSSASFDGDKTLEVKALPPRESVSSQAKTRHHGPKDIPREAQRPSLRAQAVKAQPRKETEGDETRQLPAVKADPIDTDETLPFPTARSMVSDSFEALPRTADDTGPGLPAVREVRKKVRFWSHSLQVLTLAVLAAIVIGIFLARREQPLQATPARPPAGSGAAQPSATPTPPQEQSVRPLVEEAYRLVDQLRYTEASAVLSRCLQLEPANSECRLLQTSVNSRLQQEAPHPTR
jgi:eukaryotic-like serine/threonine-protein kinase